MFQRSVAVLRDMTLFSEHDDGAVVNNMIYLSTEYCALIFDGVNVLDNFVTQHEGLCLYMLDRYCMYNAYYTLFEIFYGSLRPDFTGT